jgi:hypothetical protein
MGHHELHVADITATAAATKGAAIRLVLKSSMAPVGLAALLLVTWFVVYPVADALAKPLAAHWGL